jgi:ATP-dependent Clp protease ATP-binding subunit ClpA
MSRGDGDLFDWMIASTRELVASADRIAREVGASRVGTEHLLLAFFREVSTERTLWWREVGRELDVDVDRIREHVARDASEPLESLGISLDAVREQVTREFGRDAWSTSARAGRMPFGADAKRALELSLRIARKLRHARISPLHVMLALVLQRGRAADLLVEGGADLEQLERGMYQTLTRMFSTRV